MSTTTGILPLSSLGKKIWMALTGLFLCIFLVGHVSGNLQLLVTGYEGKLLFNEYAKFMTTFPAVKILSYVTYTSILLHAIDGIVIEYKNRASRKKKYVYNKPQKNSIWASRNMGVLGTIILAFIILHMSNFWYVMHWGPIGTMTTPEGDVIKDLHEVVVVTFQMEWYVIIYELALVAIGFHLYHGFQSAFQTLGIRHPKYYKKIVLAGKAFSVLIPLLFAVIPVYIYIVY